MTLEEVSGLDHERLIVEGNIAMPRFIRGRIRRDRILVVVPSPAFRRSIRNKIGPREGEVDLYDPRNPRARRALQTRDAMQATFAAHFLADAEDLQLKIIHNDGSRSLEDLSAEVRDHFELAC